MSIMSIGQSRLPKQGCALRLRNRHDIGLVVAASSDFPFINPQSVDNGLTQLLQKGYCNL